MQQETHYGRLYAPDIRDADYLIEPVGLRSFLFPTRHWTAGPITDQGAKPHCVGHAWRQFLEASPVRKGTRALLATHEIYRQAQLIDEWPGEAYDGTSVRAGAKVLHAAGLIREYRWASDIDNARKFVLGRGPLVVGTEWYSGMSAPLLIKGELWIEPKGSYEGGHAYVLMGYSYTKKAFRMVNSWGRGWGDGGRAWLPLDAAEQLIFRMNGEACSAMED